MTAAQVHFAHLPEFLLKLGLYAILTQMAQYIP